MTTRTQGTFEVKATTEPAYDADDAATLSRTTLEKRFTGGLEATSSVVMLGARTAVQGSAGYVALERVRGVLDGREGSFVLQHSGTMQRGKMQLELHVVPDSASGALRGLSGHMQIAIVDGAHHYTFEYELSA